MSFVHPRRVNGFAALCLIAPETVGEGEALGGIAGALAAHVLTCPMILGRNHHRAENVVAVEGEDGIFLWYNEPGQRTMAADPG